MAQPRQSLKVTHRAKTFEDHIIHANMALRDGNPGEAICYYDRVLYELSPGHICALLNRCLAYIESGHPELAVMDAYRAKIAASELREDTDIAKQHLIKVRDYIRAEREVVCANDRWTQPSESERRNGWRSSPLASIVIYTTPQANILVVGASGPSCSRILEVYATYRLCGALFMVGGGARMDALLQIDDARRLEMSSWESRWFDNLGNEIMFQVMDEIDPIDPELVRRFGDDTKEKRDERMKNLVGTMRATTIRSSYGDYPWNPFEPNLGDPEWQNHVQDWVETCSSKCTACLIQDTQSNSKPYFDLRANQDIKSTELILSERVNFNVTTSDPEQVENERLLGTLDHYFCNSCASLLVVPLQCPHKYQHNRTPVASETSPGISNTIQGSSSTEISSTVHSQQSLGSSGVPPLSAPQTSNPDFMFCSSDHLVPTCSASCRDMSDVFDKGLCDTNLERDLRWSHVKTLESRSKEYAKIQCLRDLLFLRAIVMAFNTGRNPVQIHEIAFATCGPNMRGSNLGENGEMVEPWSFTSHVVRPVRYLYQIFEGTLTNQFLRLSQVDGWMVNTLLAKINRAMCVSDGPRYAKSFGADGMLAEEFGPWDQRWDGLTVNHHSDNATEGKGKEKQEEENDDDDSKENSTTWIASINPLLNMIRIADPAKGEIPNVVIVHTAQVRVFAAERGDGGVVIQLGESLLRAKDEGTTEDFYEELRDMERLPDVDNTDHRTAGTDAQAASRPEDSGDPKDGLSKDDDGVDAPMAGHPRGGFAETYTDEEDEDDDEGGGLLFDGEDDDDEDEDGDDGGVRL